jgi:hypothetical protein
VTDKAAEQQPEAPVVELAAPTAAAPASPVRGFDSSGGNHAFGRFVAEIGAAGPPARGVRRGAQALGRAALPPPVKPPRDDAGDALIESGLVDAVRRRKDDRRGSGPAQRVARTEAPPAGSPPAAAAPSAASAAAAAAQPAGAAVPGGSPAGQAAPGAASEREVDPALEFIAGYARRVPGYGLLTAAIGADPITGQAVEGGGSLLREVVALVPGGAALMQRLEQSNAIDKAGAWLRQEIPTLGISLRSISDLFQRAWDSLTAWDLFDPAAAWERLSGIFRPPLDRVIAFAGRAADKLLELALEAMLAAGGGAAGHVLGILRRAGEAFGAIARDPLGFARNLIAAVRGGFEQFLQNIGGHLQRGLLGWLTGALQGVIRLPARLDFEGIVSIATQILGLTWDRIRERLVRLIGPRKVAFLERTVDFVREIATRGLGAAWEKIMEFASGLADQVFEAIRNWIAESVIGAAVRRLVTMFNPVGALINAVMAIYDTIQFVVERARQIGDLIDAVATSISEIASGAIGRAVGAVENALGRAVPVAIGFLAELIGLDNVGDRIRQIVERARAMVDNAIDSMIEWIKTRFSGGREDEAEEGAQQPPENETPEQRHERLATAAAAEIGGPADSDGEYDSVRAQTEEKARAAEEKFRPQMEEGIGFRVELDDAESDREDDEIDFTVVIAPNTTQVKGKKQVKAETEYEADEIFGEITDELDLEAQRESAGTPAENAQAAIKAGFVDEQGRGRLGQGEPGEKTGMRVEGGVQEHEDMRAVRETFGHSGYAYQSAHVIPSSFMDEVGQYSRGHAQTILMKREIHKFLDDHWKAWARSELPSRPDERCTVAEMLGVMRAAIANLGKMPDADPQEIRSLQAMLYNRLDAEIGELGLPMNQKVWLPWAKKKK